MNRSHIKAKAYAVLRKDNRILMHEIHEHGKLIGYRVPGGHIEFGETSREAVIREIKEELSADIRNVNLLTVTENIFVYEGAPGHEITFIYNADFADAALYDGEVVQGFEADGAKHFPLYWIDPSNVSKGLRIFPERLDSGVYSSN